MALFPQAPLGGQQVAHGYKGKGVLCHLLSDAQGHPLAVRTTASNGDERQQVLALLESIQHLVPVREHPLTLEADLGYDAFSLRLKLLNRFVYPLIPYRKIKGRERIQLALASFRWRVERTFSWLKTRYRRFLCRFEKNLEAWQSILSCMLIHYWLYNLLG